MEVLSEISQQICIITFNRPAKRNAFDEHFLGALQLKLDEALNNNDVRTIVLKAAGQDFSAGADLNWMQRMIHYSEQENLKDALILAKVMDTLYHSPKPTIAVVQGGAYGGGAGLVAACDIAIAAHNAQFCFSEVRLGLIPAIISPYVVKALGERTAKWLFMSAELLNANQAQLIQLIQYCVNAEELWPFAWDYAQKMNLLAPQAVRDCKRLIAEVVNKPLDESLSQYTASLIAKKRISAEGQKGLMAFIHRRPPIWN